MRYMFLGRYGFAEIQTAPWEYLKVNLGVLFSSYMTGKVTPLFLDIWQSFVAALVQLREIVERSYN